MQSCKTNEFKKLHSKADPLILINIWDAASAAIVQNSNASALATSSASLAWANGYPDGSKIPMETLLSAVKNISRVCEIPLTVDIEDGYSDSPEKVADFVAELVKLGVCGINIEDGQGSPELLVQKISLIKNRLTAEAPFINARTDVYLQELVPPKKMMSESIARLQKYVAAGADGVFVPAASLATDIATLSESIQAPLNIMIPNDQNALKEACNSGASRISLGPASFIDTYSTLPDITAGLLRGEKQMPLNYENLNNLF